MELRNHQVLLEEMLLMLPVVAEGEQRNHQVQEVLVVPVS